MRWWQPVTVRGTTRADRPIRRTGRHSHVRCIERYPTQPSAPGRAPTMPSSSALGSPACISCTNCATNSACPPWCSRRGTTSAAPGIGTATPAPAAILRASTTPIPFPRSCRKSGNGPSATPSTAKSAAIWAMSPIASPCARTSVSAPASNPPPMTRPPTAGPSPPNLAISIPRNSSSPPSAAYPPPTSPRSPAWKTSRANGTIPATGRKKAWISPASASA